MANPVALLNEVVPPAPRLLPAEARHRHPGTTLALRNTLASMMKLSVQLHLERTVVAESAQALGLEAYDLELKLKEIRLESGTPEGSQELSRLSDHFSADRMARRIADFILLGIGRSRKETVESRPSFADFILPIVRVGVDSALAAFGDLPEAIRTNAERTFDRIAEVLTAFASSPAVLEENVR